MYYVAVDKILTKRLMFGVCVSVCVIVKWLVIFNSVTFTQIVID